MKRYLLYVLILAAVLLIPVERTDVGKLQPVQTVAVYREGNVYIIETDTGDVGFGADAMEALESLKATTPAVIYLDTADYLLVADNAMDAVEDLRNPLKNTIELYNFIGDPDMEAVSKYLGVHGGAPRLKHWQEGLKLPTLDCRGDRINFL